MSFFTVFLFSVHTNDIPELIVNECYLYANDTKIINTVDNKILLRKDNENATVWSKENCLNFNFDKVKNMQFSLQNIRNKNIKFYDFPQMETSNKEDTSKTWAYIFQKIYCGIITWFFLLKSNQKLAYLKRSIPCETQMSKKFNLVKSYIILFLFCGSKTWYASKTIVRQVKSLQGKNLFKIDTIKQSFYW